jgi:hypothetical protein
MDVGKATFCERRNYRSSVCPDAGMFRAHMAKPNYQFEKRRREMDKKAKKAEKLKRKDSPTSSETDDATPAEDAAPASDATPESV